MGGAGVLEGGSSPYRRAACRKNALPYRRTDLFFRTLKKRSAARYERFFLRESPRGKFLHCPKNSGASRPAHSLKIKDKTQHILLGSRGFRAGRLLTGFSSPHAPFAYAFTLYVCKMPSQPLLSESRQLRHVAEALRYAALSRHIAKQNRHRTQRAQTTRKPIM